MLYGSMSLSAVKPPKTLAELMTKTVPSAAHQPLFPRGSLNVAILDPYTLAYIAGHSDFATTRRYTLAYLAGHSDFATTRRYVHPNLNAAREALERARLAQNAGRTKVSLRTAS